MQYSKQFSNFINNRILQHIFFWVFFLFLETLHFYDSTNDENVLSVFLLASSRFSSALILIYLNLLIFIPFLLEKNKTVLYILSIVSSYFIVVYSVYGIYLLFFEPTTSIVIEEATKKPRMLPALFGLTFLLTILSSLIHFAKRWIKLKDVELDFKEEQRQRLEAELNTLKAQVNPHFLFNSLNNIYSLSLDKSDLAPEMILKLSDLMSYIIYDARAKFANFKNEAEFIKNHVDLEKIRVQNRVEVNFETDENLFNYEIAPLLFTPFIENAFKYVAPINDEKACINFIFSEKEGELHFVAENSAEAEMTTFEHNNHGIGIENVKKRLQLIYPQRHKLEILHENNKFTIDLKIKL